MSQLFITVLQNIFMSAVYDLLKSGIKYGFKLTAQSVFENYPLVDKNSQVVVQLLSEINEKLDEMDELNIDNIKKQINKILSQSQNISYFENSLLPTVSSKRLEYIFPL
ncbi:hypothetical protein AB0Y31_10005 [Lactobacillus crispatus]|uniref:Uncharacterized protein n=1 Tax=Lactobacillus crispatus TaxID=47770 RepID=A0A7X4HMQ2_9LACO|nr:hypothetical protein [Lactobacillus crispatus]MYN52873.1 hypothetical protein [Lactobacillus crispatus]